MMEPTTTTGWWWTLIRKIQTSNILIQSPFIVYPCFVRDVLWVAEQVPGNIETGDVTEALLSQGYWASYNRAYFDKTKEMTGAPIMVQR